MGTGRLSTRLADMERRQRASGANTSPGMLTSRGPTGIGRKPAWRPSNRGSEMFPFRVYRSSEGDTDAETDDGWRKVVVRSGRIGQTDVTGTDGADNPDSGEGTETVITVPADTAAFAIWIEYLPGAAPSATAEIKSGNDPANNGWPGYPNPCTTEGTVCRLIALVNSTTTGALDIRQLIRADEPDWVQACINVSGTDKVINVACDGQPFSFVV